MEPMDADRTSCIDLALGSQALTSSACFCEFFFARGAHVNVVFQTRTLALRAASVQDDTKVRFCLIQS